MKDLGQITSGRQAAEHSPYPAGRQIGKGYPRFAELASKLIKIRTYKLKSGNGI